MLGAKDARAYFNARAKLLTLLREDIVELVKNRQNRIKLIDASQKQKIGELVQRLYADKNANIAARPELKPVFERIYKDILERERAAIVQDSVEKKEVIRADCERVKMYLFNEVYMFPTLPKRQFVASTVAEKDSYVEDILKM